MRGPGLIRALALAIPLLLRGICLAKEMPLPFPITRRMGDDSLLRWEKLSPSRRHRISANYARFHRMTADQRQKLRERWQAYRQMPAHEQQELAESYRLTKGRFERSAYLKGRQPNLERVGKHEVADGNESHSSMKDRLDRPEPRIESPREGRPDRAPLERMEENPSPHKH